MNLRDSSVSKQDEQQLYLQHCKGVQTSSVETDFTRSHCNTEKMNFRTGNMYKQSNSLFFPPGRVLNAYFLHLHGT